MKRGALGIVKADVIGYIKGVVKGLLKETAMYKHWKKIFLALTAFFWNACDNSSSPTGPVVGPESSSSTTNGQNSSSSIENQSLSSEAKSSSSSVEPSSSSVESSSSTPIAESSSSGVEPQPLYGVFVDDFCVSTQNSGTYTCSDGVTCVESSNNSEQVQVRANPEVAAKYGVIFVKDKTYKCSDGKVYNEAEFRARYNILLKEVEDKKTPCYMNGTNAVECDDGESYTIVTDEKGNKIYSNASVELSEKKFYEKYELLERMPVLYGPPCVFDGTCGDEEK